MKIPRRRLGVLAEVNLVSLGDIAFNCVIFFILTTSFIKGSRNVQLPELPRTEKSKAQLTVTLDAAGKIQLDGQDMPTADSLSASLDTRLKVYTVAKDREVKFRCDAKLTQAQYRPVIEAISNAGGIIGIIHQLKAGSPAAPSAPSTNSK